MSRGCVLKAIFREYMFTRDREGLRAPRGRVARVCASAQTARDDIMISKLIMWPSLPSRTGRAYGFYCTLTYYATPPSYVHRTARTRRGGITGISDLTLFSLCFSRLPPAAAVARTLCWLVNRDPQQGKKTGASLQIAGGSNNPSSSNRIIKSIITLSV